MKKSRSSVMGLTKLKNKVNRNAFDLSHRHMFTAQPGELLPIFYQWVNPNESFKLGYNGMTRTAPLNTAAFTRLRENVQYFFVPFQCLWRYFEQVVNNITTGQAGQDISMWAKSPSASTNLSTKLPYINYLDLQAIVSKQYSKAVDVCVSFFKKYPNEQDITKFYAYCVSLESSHELNSHFNSVFFNREYRYVATAKLLNSLGYGNFSQVITHDIFVNFLKHINKQGSSFSAVTFKQSEFSLKFVPRVTQSPNLSIFPLLAYHKIVNDHYRLRNWQSYQSWTSNIDYLSPTSSMDIMTYFQENDFTDTSFTMFDMEYSNLPLDYFTGVLPRAQYGDESAVPVTGGLQGISYVNFVKFTSDDNIPSENTEVKTGNVEDSSYFSLKAGSSLLPKMQFAASREATPLQADFKISSLRSAIALQKYKEIQNSNDWSFEEQVLAHFGIKPSCDIHKSRFIGGSDSTIDINPQVNQALTGDSMPEIKAIGTGTLSCECKFKSDTYGIIIGIYRCIPQLDYAHIGIDRNLYKTDASDFPLPELDSVGMQTQYRTEVAAPPIGQQYDFVPNMGLTYGYAPRYCELKTSYDRFDGGFNDAYSHWVTGLDPKILVPWFLPIHRTFDVTDLLLCSPSLLYPIFVNQWSGTANDDKLLVGSVNTCVAVRPFSVHGLPWSN